MSERNWTQVSGGDTWDPTGFKNEKNVRVDKQPTPNSFIEGYYLGSKENQGPKQKSSVHSFLVVNLEGKQLEDDRNMQLWGTAILNDALNEVRPGTYTRVQWLGKTPAKTAGKEPYHNWSVQQDKSDFRGELVGLPAAPAAQPNIDAPVAQSAPVIQAVDQPVAQVAAPVVQTPAPALAAPTIDDDLPF